MRILFFIFLIVVGPTALFAQEGNISEGSLPYIGWKLDAPYAESSKGKPPKIAPNTKMGRQIAASVEFYSLDFCKSWYDDLVPSASGYIKEAKASDPREYLSFQSSIKKAVKRLSVTRSFDACILLTSPYQAGGDAAELMPWGGEGFYIEHDQ